MINHVRTLLLNQPASATAGLPGDEYIEPSFNPLNLPAVLSGLRRILYPENLDVSAQIYVTNTLISLLESPEFADILTFFDSRISYSTEENSSIAFADTPITVTQNLSADANVEPRYELNDGRLPTNLFYAGLNTWNITRFDNRRVAVKHNKRKDPQIVTVLSQDTAKGVLPVTLIPDYAKVFMDVTGEVLRGEFSIQYSTVIPVPYTNLVARMEEMAKFIARLGDQELFDPGDILPDNIVTYKKIWNNESDVVLRFNSALAAFVIKLEELRT